MKECINLLLTNDTIPTEPTHLAGAPSQRLRRCQWYHLELFAGNVLYL